MNKQTRKLLKENNELEKQLDKETDKILTDIIVYIRGANITEYNQELVRRDITNMLIDGQNRGQSVSDVIGDDYKTFCDEVIAEMPPLTKKQKTLKNVQLLCSCIGILAFIWAVFSLPRGDFRHMAITLGEIISAALIIAVSILIVELVVHKSLDEVKMKNWVFCVVFGLIAALCVLPSLLIRRVVAVVPTAVVLIIAMLLIAADKIIDIK